MFSEEILHSEVAHWWSPDNRFITYLKLDDTNVPKYKFPIYGNGEELYSNMDVISYPKVRHIYHY